VAKRTGRSCQGRGIAVLGSALGVCLTGHGKNLAINGQVAIECARVNAADATGRPSATEWNALIGRLFFDSI
jgi:hypothetical protein